MRGTWTRREMMAVAASHLITNEDVVIVGLGLPQVAALLAKQTHAPKATLLLEIGVFEPSPTEPAMGIADPRMWAGTRAYGGMLDVLGHMLHGGRVTTGILGALQVDLAGSINSSLVRQSDGTMRRFTGSGGANDIASLATRVVVVMRHDARKFQPRVDFVTSPGKFVNGRPRAASGLPGDGTSAIVTDRGVFEIEQGGLRVRSLHSGEELGALVADTPVPLLVESPPETEPPTPQELRILREEIDQFGWYTS